MRIQKTVLTIVAAGVLGMALTGCSSSKSTSASAIRHELTPELSTLHQRPADVDNMVWHTWNADWRMFYRDFHRAALLDRPSRLSRTPSAY